MKDNMARVYISLGSNLGDRRMYINKAIEMLGPSVKNVSEIVETDPIGMENAGKFLNAVVEIETKFDPYKLLDFLEDIERRLGRIEKGNYKSRIIDLDILTYEDLVLDTQRLKIPHPKLREREFLCRLLRTLKKEKVKKK